jgi:hypothetical protein
MCSSQVSAGVTSLTVYNCPPTQNLSTSPNLQLEIARLLHAPVALYTPGIIVWRLPPPQRHRSGALRGVLQLHSIYQYLQPGRKSGNEVSIEETPVARHSVPPVSGTTGLVVSRANKLEAARVYVLCASRATKRRRRVIGPGGHKPARMYCHGRQRTPPPQ